MKRQFMKSAGICGAFLLWASLCLASGGRVSYPDGQPVVGAEVHVNLQEVDKYKLTTDANGCFTLPTMDFLDAFVQIKAPSVERIFVDHWSPRAMSGCIGDLPEQLQARETPSDRRPMLQSLCEVPFSP